MALPSILRNKPAVISDDGKYRYWLSRQINSMVDKPCVFIMLNPSTADATKDDPTIRRCIGYAKAWDCSELIVVNLFALRSAYPWVLWDDKTIDPIGPDNDDAIQQAVDIAHNGIIICAWGQNGGYMDRGNAVLGMIEHLNPCYLRLSKHGFPCHPLYLRGELKPIQFNHHRRYGNLGGKTWD